MFRKSFITTLLVVTWINYALAGGIDISDSPMETKVQSAPPLIMFLIDDSGSMDWSVMTPENDGKFGGDEYIFPETDPNYGGGVLSGTERLEWESQWSGYNKVFYNPHTNYRPWPGKNDASTTTPRGNPHGDETQTLTLNDEYASVLVNASGELIVDNEATANANNNFNLVNADNTLDNDENGGDWEESGGSSDAEYGADAQWTDNEDARAEWHFSVEETGNYDVYAWWDNYSNRDERALYLVEHDGGITSYCLNQRQNQQQWNHMLGTHNYTANQDYSIVVARHGTSYNGVSVCGGNASTGGSTLADAVRLLPAGTISDPSSISIKNSHYYTKDDNGNIYLVNLDPVNETRSYYLFNDIDSNDQVGNGEITQVSDDEVPNSVKKAKYDEDGNVTGYYSVTEDLQNFANWYSFYRRRELTAKSAIAHAIRQMEGVKVGLYSIHKRVNQEVLPVKLDMVENEEIFVVDNQDAGYSENGNWSESGGSSDEYAASAKYTTHEGDSASWNLNVPATDQYNVYAWWDCYNNRDQSAKYTIEHSGGSTSVYVNQREESGNVCNEWVHIGGPYTFDEGTSQSITVERHAASTGSSTLADAVMLESTSVSYANIDQTDTLLEKLYDMNSDGGTPLRSGLKDIGQYFDQDDNNDGNIGNSPYSSEADGGGCQKAYAIAMTDGFWNGSSPGVGNVDNDITTFSGVAPYTDAYSDTVADVAMEYYYQDIANSLSDIVPTNACDTAAHQHMSTYSVSFGVTGTIDPNDLNSDGTPGPYYENDTCFLNDSTPMPTWPNPASGDHEKIDDLWHASVNGRGTYFNAQDPEQLVEALMEIVSDIGKPTSGASVSVSTNEFRTDMAIYETQYVPNEWSGDVLAYPVDQNTGAVMDSDDDILWHAKNGVPSYSSRKIITFDGITGVNFVYSSLSDMQKGQLLFESESDAALAEARVNFVRGDTSGVETYNFRYRDSILGDVVHSSPTVSPTGKTLYFGANDGMLHAVDSETGDERFTFVPNSVFNNLKYLTKDGYSHKFFVDLTPTVKKLNPQKTMLVGGLGKGGKGIYALKLYDKEDNGTVLIDAEDSSLTVSDIASNVFQWEYSAEANNDDDLGFTYSKPAIVRSNDPDHEWVVIIGNGYSSTNESAILYIFDMDGTLLNKIDTGASGSNGLSEPAVIYGDSDYKVDYAYAGDLNGNMWKFDLRDENVENWEIAYKDEDDNPQPLFTSASQSITSRPDVMNHCEQHGYMVVFGTGKFLGEPDRTDTALQTIYGIWDYGDNDDDSEYLGQISSKAVNDASLSRNDLKLLRQTVVDARYIDSNLYRTLSNNKPVNTETPPVAWPVVDDTTSGQKSNPSLYAGWFFDLRTEEDVNDDNDDDQYNGERIVKDVTINDGRAFIVSLIPSNSPCSGGGDSFFYIMDACTGGRLNMSQFDLGTDDDLIDLDGDESTTDDRVPPTGRLFTGPQNEPTFVSNPGGPDRVYLNRDKLDITAEPLGTIYWRQLN
ncbi:MAG: hypothetical protein B6I36_08155 [Desulfobacteraceae bacterium 4572_35.1]|nr:MAG: hypothetical protein B6I36_08155 [Desulfobacteraceae bacterium 4572_35.1]